MDVLERLNRRFASVYEGLFRSKDDEDLRPRTILRRLVALLEDSRREGLDGQLYVPNVYTLTIAIEDDEERELARAFLDADELAAAIAEKIGQHGYRTRGPLQVILEEVEASPNTPRLRIGARWEAGATPTPAAPEKAPGKTPEPELKTVPTVTTPNGLAPTLATLIAQNPDGRIEEFPLTAVGVRIGRGKQADNDIVLSGDAMISKKHARVAFEHGGFVLYDEGSTNGTHYKGTKLQPGQGVALDEGEELVLGQTRLTLRLVGEAQTVAAPFAAARPAVTPPPVAPERTLYRLITASGEAYPLASHMLLGRALTDDIVLVGSGISAQHARLTQRDGLVLIEDLDTPEGTIVNGERIPANFPVALYPGDTVQLGEVTLRLAAGGPVA